MIHTEKTLDQKKIEQRMRVIKLQLDNPETTDEEYVDLLGESELLNNSYLGSFLPHK